MSSMRVSTRDPVGGFAGPPSEGRGIHAAPIPTLIAPWRSNVESDTNKLSTGFEPSAAIAARYIRASGLYDRTSSEIVTESNNPWSFVRARTPATASVSPSVIIPRPATLDRRLRSQATETSFWSALRWTYPSQASRTRRAASSRTFARQRWRRSLARTSAAVARDGRDLGPSAVGGP